MHPFQDKSLLNQEEFLYETQLVDILTEKKNQALKLLNSLGRIFLNIILILYRNICSLISILKSKFNRTLLNLVTNWIPKS